MLFTSYGFILFFAVLLAVYYLIPKRFQWLLLLAASYVFYAFLGIKFLIYILAATATTFYASYRINRSKQEQADYLESKKDAISREQGKEYKALMKKRQKKWLIICLLINFGVLFALKYIDFSISNINSVIRLFNPERELSYLKLAVPLGISFYTFQSMGYLIDVYRGKYSYEKSILRLALFISYFPQLVQGPISRFDRLKQTLFEEHSYDRKNASLGLQRVLWGFFKKLVIADRLLVAVSTITGSPEMYTGIYVVLGMLFYAIELYADFSGGIDIALGISQMLGVRMPENFNRPYFSKSIAEYWRRWHITLGTWFKDYLFYPISVSKPVLNLSKKCRSRFGNALGKRVPVYIATMVVWFSTGIWHGSSWNFIVWGLLNAVVILASHECTPLYSRFHSRFSVANTFWYRLFQVARTFWLMSLLRTLDCYQGVGTTFRMFGTVFTHLNIREVLGGGLLNLGLSTPDYMVLILSITLMIAVSLKQRAGSVRERLYKKPLMLRYCTNFALFFSTIVFGAYGAGYNASQFIYSQF